MQKYNLIALTELQLFAIKILSVFATLSSTVNTAIQELDDKKINKTEIPNLEELKSLSSRVTVLELLSTNINSNQFSITFDSLNAINSKNIKQWNANKKIICF